MEYYIYLKLVPINSLKSNIIDFIFIESKKIDSHTIWWVLKVEVKLCFAAMSILLVYPAGPIHASITLFSLAFGIWTAILQWLQFSSFLFICYWVTFILIGTKLLDSLPLIDSVSLKEAFCCRHWDDQWHLPRDLKVEREGEGLGSSRRLSPY